MNNKPYNILFILTDQERYLDPDKHASLYDELPARNRLRKHGITFTKHHINTAVCTPSRSVIYSGQHIQRTGMFDNLEYYWSNDFSTNIPTLGDMMDKAGYYSAYKGKWHLALALEEHSGYDNLPTKHLTKVMEEYGFKDYVGVGDIIGTTWGGYINDEMIGAQTQRWLRMKGQPLNANEKPWFKAVNLVNPHDAMFFNTDAPPGPEGPVEPAIQNSQDEEQLSQASPKTISPIAPAPLSKAFRKRWTEIDLPKTLNEKIEKPGRPKTHKDWDVVKGALTGVIANDPADPECEARWQRLQDYYFNCIRKTDEVVEGILDELDELGLMENTIIVMTADHGELGGAHGLSGKGNTAYEEQTHVPLIIHHPEYNSTNPEDLFRQCHEVTSHLDLAPTLVNWACQAAPGSNTHMDITQKLQGYDLCGEDLSPLLKNISNGKTVEELHPDGVLYCYNMYSIIDGEFALSVQQHLNTHGGTYEGFEGVIDLETKKGAIRSVFDGRYKYSRYFSNKHHNMPGSNSEDDQEVLQQIYDNNEVELFDLGSDPHEEYNLAYEAGLAAYNHALGDGKVTQLELKVRDKLLLEMNAKMNRLIEQQVGNDDGSYLPNLDGPFTMTHWDP